MAQLIKQADIFGRLGTGVGKGLAEQIPKEIEHNRFASGLQQLERDAPGLNPQQYYTRALQVRGLADRPQLVQSLGDFARQQAIINSSAQPSQLSPDQYPQRLIPQESPSTSATTTRGVQATLNPYIPPTGDQKENMARQLLREEPAVYRDIDSARAAVDRREAANEHRSNAEIRARQLEQDVQRTAEGDLSSQISRLGAQVPATILSDIERKAVDDVRTGKLTEKDAAVKYGEEANQISRDLSTARGWGDIGLVTNSPKALISSMKNLSDKFYEMKRPREFADYLVSENGLTPQFAYAQAMPVNKIPSLNDSLKNLPDIKPKAEKVPGVPGLGGIGVTHPKAKDIVERTQSIAPTLARSMGKDGSPLSVAYELEKKGYDPQIWKDYLIENQKDLDLTLGQVEELSKTQPKFFGWLNDWWLKSFSGIK